jgi:hypothetical protein
MGVAGPQGAGLGLHPGDGGVPAAAQRGQNVHGVVARAEEDPAPQVGHLVGQALLDSDEAAAGPDVRQFRPAHRVLGSARQGR